ncbi:TetR/AcrR family transcriptional regulator C-terminal domain-containing protein [Streptomyces sp. NBC_00091]|uniref:TetR/AcrR family transcriptional regulator n=1 Tax=Streptomyces sp. NBC_00091 TaxID=2975648 RepID=UPI0022520EA2|nr:TetR/AcrR family transcriptional regulator C-terminal domain-containing protein [Streptomyces sp. NBC_00091]MCX5377284.1 TetR/AcrR family transcriptional regulator [Streptomyces sp. NBC_00091]
MVVGNDARTAAQAQCEVTPRKLAKRIALAKSACGVFGREGYARASVDALAAAAGVSTRTLYNHFPGGKAELFATVVTWTSGEVRDAHLAKVRALLDPALPPHPDNLERDLTALARALVDVMSEHSDHFALVRHIHAEADHVPSEVLEAWKEAGPRPVARALADAMAGLAAAGLIDVHGDPDLAGAHFVTLASQSIVQQSHYGVLPLTEEETDRLLTGGVAAFLRAYRTT